MNPKDPARVLDEISDAQVPQDLNLLPGILAKAQQGNRITMKTAAQRRFFAALLLVLVLLIALFSLPGVASALQKMIGYIPGIGAVDQSAPLRVLAGPVTDTRGGYTITVESALLDSSRTVLDYRITGQFPKWADPSLEPRMCQDYPILRLPDGKELRYPSREGGPGDGDFTWRDVFTAVPAGQNSAVLVLPCLAGLPAGEGPMNWEIPLAFAPAPPDMTVYPVIAPPVITVAPTIAPPTKAPASVPTAVSTMQPPVTLEPAGFADWIQVTLEGVAALQDGYYLQTRLHWQNDPNIAEVQLFQDAVHLYDAAGQEVPVWLADGIPPFAQAADQSLAVNLQTGPIVNPGPTRLVVDAVEVRMLAPSSFRFDVGSDPQPGQTWQLNKDLEINGYHLRVHSAEYVKPEPGEPPWLMLYLSSDSGIQSVIAMDAQREILGTGGSPASAQVPFRAGWRYKDGFPQGEIQVDITMISVPRSGPWSMEWTPNVDTSTAPAAVQAQAKGICQEQVSLPSAPADLPAGLGGRAAFSDETYHSFVANLDGSARTFIGYAIFPDLSPNGARVVYRAEDMGLYIRDLVGGNDMLIPGTNQKDIYNNWPRWSPDGSQIAFDRVAGHGGDIYLVNADGSDLRAVVSSPDEERLLGWSPDGNKISYQAITPNGQVIRVLDLATGHIYEAAQLAGGIMQASLSPDGKRMLYSHEQGIFLDALDGSPAVLLAAAPPLLADPVWSPDGRWIALAYYESDADFKPDLVLLQLDTCQFISLGDVGGKLESWVR